MHSLALRTLLDTWQIRATHLLALVLLQDCCDVWAVRQPPAQQVLESGRLPLLHKPHHHIDAQP
jgi:hypothetical protein